uniref:myosin-binding protein 1-like n=1 Tax=Erigeron canadensis TaxID=72917 RepID=UPI001CB9B21F|nr:myosin-binding protein 1-like [Erigeron canadensis]
MGTKNNSSFQSPNYFHNLSKALEFAVSEWLLMFLLFIDACFTYLIAKFASYCQLQGPCLLCSRYDHVLARDNKGIHRDSICNHHKSEISSVVLCHVHDRLVDPHGICENCLLSFASNKLDDETLRLLVRNMKSDPLHKDSNRDSIGSRICGCCNDQYLSKDYVKNLLSASTAHYDDSESLLMNGEHAKNEKNIFVDESLESFKSSHIGENHIASSSEFKYQKVDVNSDNELEHPVSDNGSAHALVPGDHLQSASHFEVPYLHNGHTTVATRDSKELKWQGSKEDMSQITEQISLKEVLLPSSNNVETPVDPFLDTRKDEPIKDPMTESDPSATTNGHQVSNYLDLGDAYKLAISTKARQLSGKLLDQRSFKDSSARANEDLKILLPHRSNDNLISPKLSFNSDELTSMHFLQSRISLERNESNLSLDGSVLSEIEGESMVDRLKRQVEHDKRLMGALYRELEEERNASAVATNQAMAMITRLQEEKAALYTEALQSLRMMEEQAEYDSEALQKANDLIEEKDKQIQELEDLLTKTNEDIRD